MMRALTMISCILSTSALRLVEVPDQQDNIELTSDEGEGIFMDFESEAYFDKKGHKKVLGAINGGLEFGEGCPDAKHPKVAVCLAGLSRGFASKGISDMINDKLLSPLQELGCSGLEHKTKPDVFVHVKAGGFPVVAQNRDQTGVSVSNTRENLEMSCSEIDAVNYVIEDGFGTHGNRSQLGNPSCFHPHGPVENVMSYYWSINGCLNLLKKAEAKHGQKYDHVVFARPDFAFYPPKEDQSKGVQCNKALFVGDQHSYQPRAAFEMYGNIWNTQFMNPNPSLCGMKASYETFVQEEVRKISAAGVVNKGAVYIR